MHAVIKQLLSNTSFAELDYQQSRASPFCCAQQAPQALEFKSPPGPHVP